MSKTDEFDRRRAAAYAWRFVKPGEKVPDAEEAEERRKPAEAQAEAKEPTEAEQEAYRQKAYDACAALAGGVDRVWTLAGAEQVQAVSSLLSRAQQLGLQVAAMQHFPLQSVRLMRLAIRCRDNLSEEARKAARACAIWLDYSHPEVVELLAEVAIAGESSIGAALQMALDDEHGEVIARAPGASARFARVLDEGPHLTARRFAIRWLDMTGVRDAVPALRRTLGRHHFGLAFWALELLERVAPQAVQAADIALLVQHIEAHPPPEIFSSEENRRAHTYFPEILRGAIGRLRPADAAEPLASIADSERERIYSGRGGFHATWALSALATAFPEQAVPRIDHLLRREEWDRRTRAVQAAGHLPDELAWPRLLEAAADPVPEVAAHAQAIWLKRRGSLCPLGELAGVEVVLLDKPPSERMLSRLALLRRAPLAARAAMVEVLFGEAPDPEALVLLLFAANDPRLWVRSKRPGIPQTRTKFCHAITAGFGARGVQGLCANAARYPEGRSGWLNALATVVREAEIPEEAFAVLRAVAAKRIAETPEDAGDDTPAMLVIHDALRILAKVGAPLDFAPRLRSLARDSGKLARFLRDTFRNSVADAWKTLPAGEARLDGAVIAEISAALGARDLPHFAHAAFFGLRLGLAAAVTLSEQVLVEHMDATPEDPAITDALEVCLNELERLGRIDSRFSAVVARPGTVAFCLAARRARRARQNAAPEELDALRKAMSSEEPSTAAEAATALLRAEAIGAEAEELIAIAARAPLRVRSELVWNLLYGKVAPRTLWPLLREILVSADPDVTDHFDCMIHRIAQGDVREDLVALAPDIASAYLYARIADSLPLEEPDSYWEDAEEDE